MPTSATNVSVSEFPPSNYGAAAALLWGRAPTTAGGVETDGQARKPDATGPAGSGPVQAPARAGAAAGHGHQPGDQPGARPGGRPQHRHRLRDPLRRRRLTSGYNRVLIQSKAQAASRRPFISRM